MSNAIFLGSEIVSVFQDGNSKKFICNARASVKGQVFTEIGSGQSVDAARRNAESNLKALINKSGEGARSNHFDNDPCQYATMSAVISKDSLKGGGSKKASEKQVQFLLSLAERKNQQIKELIQEKFKKSINELFGYEADALIKSLKDLQE